ncbi:MAG: ABC transporter permease subunit [Gemmataceae bacterium]|nr:ABC transporter permease subunit [Gemmataceae bacterium]
MRWSIIRLIWQRELRDQLRDRRTVFMVAILPVLIYPLAGFGMLTLASAFFAQRSTVAVAGLENALPWIPGGRPANPGRVVGLLAPSPFSALAFHLAPPRDYPPLFLRDEEGTLRFDPRYVPNPALGGLTRLEAVELPPAHSLDGIDRSLLDYRKADVLLVVPPGFQERVEAGEAPPLYVLGREKDEASRLARSRVLAVLEKWNEDLRAVRHLRQGLPPDFAEGFRVVDGRPRAAARAQEDLAGLLARVFPFVLVLWSLAGALYPAVDLCAGEKERGTMETLLISPASREEIVWGKFLTIWVFSAATALLNLASMWFTTWQFSRAVSVAGFRPAALLWAVILLLPLSAFFSALCLAVGAYARSSKEGQYYLMPLFLGTMPLVGITMAPGVELNSFLCMVPITGVALLLQRLVTATADAVAWGWVLPVLAPMVVYSWLALRWAVAQFRSEEVLFREAERLDLGLWLKRLLREKEPWPSAGEAVACAGLLLFLRWLSFGTGAALPLWASQGVGQLAFVAAPPLFMALLLTTRPLQGVGLRPAPGWAYPVAVAAALATLPPLAETAFAILRQLPAVMEQLDRTHPVARAVRGDPSLGPGWLAFLLLAVMPALCEEIAFRGYILTGLSRAFHPLAAVLLSAFFFAVWHLDVALFVPQFLLGTVLAFLALRAGSVLPAILFRLVHNALLLWPLADPVPPPGSGRLALAAGGVVAAAALALALPKRSP